MSAVSYEPPLRRVTLSPLRLGVLLGSIAVVVLAASGLVVTHVFAVPDTAKYLVTVAAPTLLALLALVDNPLRLLAGLAIVLAPVSIVTTLSDVQFTPLLAVLVLAAVICVFRAPARRPSRAGIVAIVSCVLLVPAIVIGVQQLSYVEWLATTLLMAWIVFVAAREPGGARFVVIALAVSVAIQGALALWEFRSGHRLDLYQSSLPSASDKFFSFGSATRAVGTLPDPIGLGNIIAFALPLIVTLAVIERRPALRAFLTASAAVGVLGVVLSFSRMSWIGAGVGTVLAVLLLPGRARVTGVVSVALLTTTMIIVALSVGGLSLRDRAGSVLDPTQSSNSETRITSLGDQYRARLWQAALTSAGQAPIIGRGFGRLGPALTLQGVPVPSFSHAHNTYLQFLGEAGVLGLIALLAPLLTAFRDAAAAFRRHRAMAAGVAGGLVAMLFAFITDVEIRYVQVSATIAAVLALAAALAVSNAGSPARAANRRERG